MKHDESAEHIVRSSILKLLRKDEFGRADSSAQHGEDTSPGGALHDIWALQPKAPGSRPRFEA